MVSFGQDIGSGSVWIIHVRCIWWIDPSFVCFAFFHCTALKGMTPCCWRPWHGLWRSERCYWRRYELQQQSGEEEPAPTARKFASNHVVCFTNSTWVLPHQKEETIVEQLILPVQTTDESWRVCELCETPKRYLKKTGSNIKLIDVDTLCMLSHEFYSSMTLKWPTVVDNPWRY